MKTMFAIIKPLLTDFTNLFFPHYCTGCGTGEIQPKQLICARCHSRLPETGFLSQQGNPVEKKFYGRLDVYEAGSAYFYTKHSVIQKIMFELKYKKNRDAGFFLGRMLGIQMLCSGRFASIECIVPLPLNKKREKDRGYNQALAIAEGVADIWEIPVITDAVARNAYTETQTHKDRVSRWETMQDAFSINDATVIAGKHVLLVDDVLTTGATLEACGTKILEVPNTTLSIATAAAAMS